MTTGLVPGIEGFFLNNGSTSPTGVDPQTVLGDTFGGSGTTTVDLDVIANQTAPDSLSNGGVAEFDTTTQVAPANTNPTIALNGSGTADAPFILDTLISHTGVSYTERESDALVSGLAGNRLTRAAVLLRIAEDERFVLAKRKERFVMMEYFGHLRRDPDESGYQFWLTKLNEFDGNFEQAEMVKAFINSGEYRARFH